MAEPIRNPFLPALGGILLCVLLAGCPSRTPQPPGQAPSATEVLERAAQRGAGIAALRTDARVSYYGEEGARKARSVIMARRPDQLYAAFLGPTDNLLAVSASDGSRFTSFEWGAPVCYTGPSCPENIAPWLGAGLGGQDIVRLLLGDAPDLQAVDSEASWDGRAGAWRVRARWAPGRLVDAWFDDGSWGLRQLRLVGGADAEGLSGLSIRWDDPTDVGGVRLPHRIQIEGQGGSRDLQIRYREPEVNPEIGSDAFQISCPGGTEVREVLCPATGAVPAGKEAPEGTDG